MNKKYIILILVSTILTIATTSVKSQDASIVIRIDTKDNTMKEHVGATSKDKATVTQRNSSNVNELLQWGSPNVSFNGAWYTGAARLYNSTVAGGALQYPNYPYLEIQRTGTNKFTHIEIVGVFDQSTAMLSMIPMGFSENGTTFTDFQTDEPYLYFGGDESKPLPGQYAGPAIAFDADYTTMTTKIPVPENINYIRIAASNKSFSGTPLSSGFDPAYIYQVSLWTKDDGIPSSIDNANSNSFSVNKINDELHFTEPALQISIYNISGQLVQTAVNTQILPLNNFPTGIYVVKATSTTGKNIITKIAR